MVDKGERPVTGYQQFKVILSGGGGSRRTALSGKRGLLMHLSHASPPIVSNSIYMKPYRKVHRNYQPLPIHDRPCSEFE